MNSNIDAMGVRTVSDTPQEVIATQAGVERQACTTVV